MTQQQRENLSYVLDKGHCFLRTLAMAKMTQKNRNSHEEKRRTRNTKKASLIWIALKVVCSAFNINRGQVWSLGEVYRDARDEQGSFLPPTHFFSTGTEGQGGEMCETDGHWEPPVIPLGLTQPWPVSSREKKEKMLVKNQKGSYESLHRRRFTWCFWEPGNALAFTQRLWMQWK